MTVEVVAIAAKGLSETVRVIQHRGDAVETETVELELLEPVFAVGQQEMDYLMLAIVETERIPLVMLPSVARIEELVRVAAKVAQALVLILYSVRLNKIHNDCNTVLVSLVNESLQFLWSTEPA